MRGEGEPGYSEEGGTLLRAEGYKFSGRLTIVRVRVGYDADISSESGRWHYWPYQEVFEVELASVRRRAVLEIHLNVRLASNSF